ncbi:tetraspanin-7-like [Tubulanus polymorphus]|uniref:tetraspanin-7-like n=1 Tax=Tubulanus polymorphus TaxID=672921 RepID=UPI003DA499F1
MAGKAAIGCLKTLMMVFNFIFWVTGIALLALGIWMKLDLYRYMELTTTYYPQAPYILIGIGAAIIIIGTLGCCCTVKGYSILLYVFSVFLVLMFIAELAAGITGFVFKGQLESGFEEGLNKAYSKYGTDKQLTKDVDDLQKGLHCCGMNSTADWDKLGHRIPDSCCKTPKCNTKDPNAIYTKGCFKLVTEFMKNNFSIIGGSVIGVSFLMLIGALLACCLARSVKMDKYEQVA